MTLEVFHVFEHEGGGPMEVDDFSEGKKEIALFHVLKAMQAAEGYFLGDPGDAEGLTGKSGAKNISA